jgi:hypothetical protein
MAMSLLGLPAAASLAEELPEPINTVEARGSIIIDRFDAPVACKVMPFATLD